MVGTRGAVPLQVNTIRNKKRQIMMNIIDKVTQYYQHDNFLLSLAIVFQDPEREK